MLKTSMILFMIPWQPILLAIGNRCRGGLIDIESGQLGRLLFWASPLSFVLFTGSHFDILWQNALYAFALIIFSFLGCCWPAWGPYVHLTQSSDWKNLTISGMQFIGPSAIVSCFSSISLGITLILGGLCISPCYWLAKKIPSKIKGFETGVPIGEILLGGCIGMLFYLRGLILG